MLYCLFNKSCQHKNAYEQGNLVTVPFSESWEVLYDKTVYE
jgi:hypothetical protein